MNNKNNNKSKLGGKKILKINFKKKFKPKKPISFDISNLKKTKKKKKCILPGVMVPLPKSYRFPNVFNYNTNNGLVNSLIKKGLLKLGSLEESIFRKVDRKDFVLNKSIAYSDNPSPIIESQTISAPHIHAHAISSLIDFLKPESKVLDGKWNRNFMCYNGIFSK